MDVVRLQQVVRAGLAGAADPARAVEQQRYMHSELPYAGVSMPELRRLQRSWFAELEITERADWDAAVRQLWGQAEVREEWYVAIGLARLNRYRGWASEPSALALYRELIVAGSWWDVVDEISQHLVGAVVAEHEVADEIRRWSVADQLWVRRAAILSQERHDRPDEHLLADVIEANLTDSPYGGEFFIRKAIGWALRSYSKRAGADWGGADWVRTFIEDHADRLAPLSVREASKYL